MNKTITMLILGLGLLCSFIGCNSEAKRIEQEKSEKLQRELSELLSGAEMSKFQVEANGAIHRLAAYSSALPEQEKFAQAARSSLSLAEELKAPFEGRDYGGLAAKALEGLVLCENASAESREKRDSFFSLNWAKAESVSSSEIDSEARKTDLYRDWGELFVTIGVPHRTVVFKLMTDGPKEIRLSTFRLVAKSLAGMRPVDSAKIDGPKLAPSRQDASERFQEMLVQALKEEPDQQNKQLMKEELSKLGITADSN